VALALVATVAACSAPSGSAPRLGATTQYSPPTTVPSSPPSSSKGSGARAPARPIPLGTYVTGTISAPGGPFLTDRFGRVVILHGVNAVEKNPPYLLTVAPGQDWNFSVADAKAIASLGFNTVRLGILWQGLEPGTGGPNDPAVCTPGKPANPHLYDSSTASAYLAKVRKTVDLLGRYHIYSVLDMHQDVYNQLFRGEGAPTWAVCTDELAPLAVGGRWSANYHNPALDVAMAHFWNNDVVGDLQGEYDKVWGTVAHTFANDPWIIGYDPINEPFSTQVTLDDTRVFADLLECFYTGRAHPGSYDSGDKPIVCPPDDPAQGVVPTIEKADPHHLVFVEPDIYSVLARPNLLGPMNYPRLVFSFHSYCGARSPVTGDPTDVSACFAQIDTALGRRVGERALMSTPDQPGGPPLMLGEFGATGSSELLAREVHDTDNLLLNWTYWQWKYYNDPTGSSDEALADPTGTLASTASALSQPYAQAIAGTPITMSYDSSTGIFELVYNPVSSPAPTVIIVPSARHYPNGYCTKVVAGAVVSAPGATRMLVDASGGATEVDVTITPGQCTKPAGTGSPLSRGLPS
jgi:endoglycosylceramidase